MDRKGSVDSSRMIWYLVGLQCISKVCHIIKSAVKVTTVVFIYYPQYETFMCVYRF